MSINEIHVGDVGTILRITVKDENDAVVDISAAVGAGAKQLYFEKPETNSTVIKDAEFDSDGTDGKLKYTVVVDDLDEQGTWKIQAKIDLGGGSWRSDVGTFEVYKNIEEPE